MTLGRILIHTEMDDGVEFPGPMIAMHGVDTPGRHVVEVVRSGGPRDGERKGWAVLDLGEEGEGGGWEKGGYAFTIFKTLKEAQAAASLASEDEAIALDDIPSRFVLDVVREMSPGLVPSWNVGLERWFKEHESTTVDDYAASFLREHDLTLFGEAPVDRWAEFYRGWE